MKTNILFRTKDGKNKDFIDLTENEVEEILIKKQSSYLLDLLFMLECEVLSLKQNTIKEKDNRKIISIIKSCHKLLNELS